MSIKAVTDCTWEEVDGRKMGTTGLPRKYLAAVLAKYYLSREKCFLLGSVKVLPSGFSYHGVFGYEKGRIGQNFT